jgi:pimeloyl-ACP methyl ester carboxylesterase
MFNAHANRLGHEEFLRWYRLSAEVKLLLSRSAGRETNIPTIFVMGDADYMFRRYAQNLAKRRTDTIVSTIPDSGHVCSIENPRVFNAAVLDFLDIVA